MDQKTHLDDLSALSPVETRNVLIAGPGGQIEAMVAAPRQPATKPAFAVVCHPHPLFGGAMSNKVVYTLASSASKAGLYTLRFNFRGVGASAGPHDHGRGETDDTCFLADWMLERLPGATPFLAGFSFGAWISIRAAARVRPCALVSVAPPFGKYVPDQEMPLRPPCPWLVIHAVDDEVVDYAATRQLLESYEDPPELVTMEQAGHFFHGKLTDLDHSVRPFLEQFVR